MPDFTEDFRSDVKKLSNKYDKSDPSCVRNSIDSSIASVIFWYLRRMVEDQLKLNVADGRYSGIRISTSLICLVSILRKSTGNMK